MAGVKTTSSEYDRFSPKWLRARHVVAGQDDMHTAGIAYLPKLKAEDDKEYRARVKRSDFFNGTFRTIDALGGMAFRKPPTVEVPKAIEPYLDDVNMAGLSMESLAKECVEEVLSVGRIGVLVDHPPLQTDEGGNVVSITVDVAEKRGLRPSLKLYATESIRNWKFARVNNAWVLSMVVLGESVAVPEDEFKDKMEDRYRVLDLVDDQYRQRVFMVDDKGNDVLLEEFVPLMNGKALGFIPFKVIDPNGNAACVDEPPLIDLIDKNIAHYQVNSDYRHGAHFTALPTLFLAGIDTDADGKAPKILIGGSAAITSSHPEARGEYIEFQGQGLGALEKMLDRIERQMALLGARMIADETKQAETLGATQIKRAGENSVLAKIVQSVSEALEWSLTVFAEWAGQKVSAASPIVYQINRDFMPAMMDAQTLNAIFAGVQSGEISKQEAFALMQRGDLIDGEKTYSEHQAEIDIETPAPVRPDANPGDKAVAA